jgi:hypothetical protein
VGGRQARVVMGYDWACRTLAAPSWLRLREACRSAMHALVHESIILTLRRRVTSGWSGHGRQALRGCEGI